MRIFSNPMTQQNCVQSLTEQETNMAAQCAGLVFMTHVLKTFYCRGALGTRVNPDTIGCLWTDELDFNTSRVDGEIFKSGKKKLRIQKYPHKCERGLNIRLKKLLKMSHS